MVHLAQRIGLIKPSVTLAIAAKAGKLRAEGIDVVNFSAGEPDFDTPEHIKAAAVSALKQGMTKYTDVRGIEVLREAIAAKYQRDYGLSYGKDNVLVSCGAKHALYNVFQAIIDPGDEILIPAPYWVSYSDMALLAGGAPKILASDEADGFRIRPDQLAAALTDRSRAFVLNSPCNPTGAAYSADELRVLARILEAHDCWIISDEIYDKIVYDDFQTGSLVALNPALRDRTIIINGVSKTYAMTGWRIGYAIGPHDIVAAAATIQSQSTSNPTSIAQAAALEAICGRQDEVSFMVRQFQVRRDLIVDGLNAIEGIRCLKPQGAFYAFPNIAALLGRTGNGKKLQSPSDLADYLLEAAQVAVVPGEDFGSREHIRFSYATSPEQIEKGCQRIGEAIRRLS